MTTTIVEVTAGLGEFWLGRSVIPQQQQQQPTPTDRLLRAPQTLPRHLVSGLIGAVNIILLRYCHIHRRQWRLKTSPRE